MKTCLLWLCLFLLNDTLVQSQTPIGNIGCPPGENCFDVIITGTGQASGHIADLAVKNITNSDATFNSGPMVILSSEHTQIELPIGQYSVTIPKGKEVTIPINGYCADVFKPTAPKGTVFPTPVSPTPEQTILIEQLNKIITAFDMLSEDGAITTPFSGDPVKERETVIQQTFWIHTAHIQGMPYGLPEICESVELQFNEIMKDPPLPDGVLKEGISQLWDAIFKTGTEAKIPAFMPVPLPPDMTTIEKIPIESAIPNISNYVKATGTGRTTGHIADLTITNPTDKPVIFTFGPGSLPFDGKPLPPGKSIPTGPTCFIPSDGGYQPYIMPDLSPVMLEGGQTKIVPLNGFCVDIHLPPVPSGKSMPSINDWITPSTVDLALTKTKWAPPAGSIQNVPILVVPTQEALPLHDVVVMVSNTRPIVLSQINPTPYLTTGSSGSSNTDCIPGVFSTTPTYPGTTTPMHLESNTSAFPDLAPPLLMDAMSRITAAYDDLKDEGKITTPFSSNPEKEREAVIQQTFWKYSAELSGKKYDKQDFHNQTIQQFEKNMGTPYSTTPQPQQDKVNQGVTDFWDTFEAVGVEAKILSIPVPLVPPTPTIDLKKGWENYNTTQDKVL